MYVDISVRMFSINDNSDVQSGRIPLSSDISSRLVTSTWILLAAAVGILNSCSFCINSLGFALSSSASIIIKTRFHRRVIRFSRLIRSSLEGATVSPVELLEDVLESYNS